MPGLNLTLLERLGQLEAEQHRVAETILELQGRSAITDKPTPAQTASTHHLANWSRRGLNLRPPDITV